MNFWVVLSTVCGNSILNTVIPNFPDMLKCDSWFYDLHSANHGGYIRYDMNHAGAIFYINFNLDGSYKISNLNIANSACINKTISQLYTEGNAFNLVNSKTQDASPINKGLIAYYPFVGDSKDYSGFLNHGTVNNAALSTGHDGICNSAYSFNGIDSYIKVADGSLFNFPNNDLSLSFWLKPDATQKDFAGILDKDHMATQKGWGIQKSNAGGCNYYFGYRINDSGSDLGWTDNFGNVYKLSCSSDAWNHIVITKEVSSIKCYLNGSLQATEPTTYSNIFGNGNAPLYIGYSGGDRYFKGLIDQLRIYTRALADSEVNYLKNLSTAISFDTVSTKAKQCLESTSIFKMNGIGTKSYKNFSNNGYDWITADSDFVNSGKVHIKPDNNILPGTYQITASAVDACGNTLNGGTIDVVVESAEPLQDTEKGCTIKNHKIFDKYFNISCFNNQNLSSNSQYFHIEKQIDGRFKLDNSPEIWHITKQGSNKFLIKDTSNGKYLKLKNVAPYTLDYTSMPEQSDDYWEIVGKCDFITKNQYNKYEEQSLYDGILQTQRRCDTTVQVNRITLNKETLSGSTDKVQFDMRCGTGSPYEKTTQILDFDANNRTKVITGASVQCSDLDLELNLSVNNKSLYTLKIPTGLYRSYPGHTKIEYLFYETDLSDGIKVLEYNAAARASCAANITGSCEIEGSGKCSAAGEIGADIFATADLQAVCSEPVVTASHHPIVGGLTSKMKKAIHGAIVSSLPQIEGMINRIIDNTIEKLCNLGGNINAKGHFKSMFQTECAGEFNAKCSIDAKATCDAQFNSQGDLTIKNTCMTVEGNVASDIQTTGNLMASIYGDFDSSVSTDISTRVCVEKKNEKAQYIVEVVYLSEESNSCIAPEDFMFLNGKTADITQIVAENQDIAKITMQSGKMKNEGEYLFHTTYYFPNTNVAKDSLCNKQLKIPCLDELNLVVTDNYNQEHKANYTCSDYSFQIAGKYKIDAKIENPVSYYNFFASKSNPVCYQSYQVDTALKIKCNNDQVGNFFKLFFFWETPECVAKIDLNKPSIPYKTDYVELVSAPKNSTLVDSKVGVPLINIANDRTKYESNQLEIRMDIITHNLNDKIYDEFILSDSSGHQFSVSVIGESLDASFGIDQSYALGAVTSIGLGLMSVDII